VSAFKRNGCPASPEYAGCIRPKGYELFKLAENINVNKCQLNKGIDTVFSAKGMGEKYQKLYVKLFRK